jgi:glycerol-3-phosphate dehydrogenase subunit C
MVDGLIINKKIAYYSGCFANYYYPEAGKATVEVLHHNGLEVVIPKQVCCGLPMMSKGNIKGAHRNIAYNAIELGQLVSKGYALVTTCSSCALFLKKDYPRLLNNDFTKKTSQNIYHITEYLLKLHEVGFLSTEFKPIPKSIFYHTPCHLRAQQIGNPTTKLIQLIPGIRVKQVSEQCCGMGGAYGYEKNHYTLSKTIAGKLYEDIKETASDFVITDCGGCKLQIESGTDSKVCHPIILMKEAYGL